MKNKMSIFLIGILLCISIGASCTVSATSPHSVWGYIYIKDMNQQNPAFVLAPANVMVTLEFFGFEISHTTNATSQTDPFYGWYQIDFSGFEEQTGSFKISYGEYSDLIPETNKTVTINEANSVEGKGWNYHYDLYVILQEDETNNEDPPNNNGGGGGGGAPPVVIIQLIPPIADASNTPRSGFVDEPINLDGSKSYDEDGTIVNYTWNIHNKQQLYGEIVSYTFKEAGLYQIVLTVTDDSGQKNIDSFSISIETGNNPPKDISLDGPQKTRRLIMELFSITAFDPDNDTLIYTVNWGDGGIETISSELESGTPFETSHRWETYGVYTIQVTVKDQNNATASKSFNIYIDSQYIDGVIKGLLIDEDGDGIYDSFIEQETGVKTQVQQKNETTFLIDANNDGVMYLFDSYTNTVSTEKQATDEGSNEPLPLLLIGGILLFLICIIVGLVVYRNQQQSKTSKK